MRSSSATPFFHEEVIWITGNTRDTWLPLKEAKGRWAPLIGVFYKLPAFPMSL